MLSHQAAQRRRGGWRGRWRRGGGLQRAGPRLPVTSRYGTERSKTGWRLIGDQAGLRKGWWGENEGERRWVVVCGLIETGGTPVKVGRASGYLGRGPAVVGRFKTWRRALHPHGGGTELRPPSAHAGTRPEAIRGPSPPHSRRGGLRPEEVKTRAKHPAPTAQCGCHSQDR